METEEPLCFTLAGEEGKCRLAASCIGATISELETNNCELGDGSQGTCCVSISTDNVINIIDTPLETVALPGSVDTEQADDIIIRSSLGQEDDRVRFASEEPAEDVEVDTNFVDDPTPSNFHLRSELKHHIFMTHTCRHVQIQQSPERHHEAGRGEPHPADGRQHHQD